jgi:rfaE bifunctional protein kinase chain/domain
MIDYLSIRRLEEILQKMRRLRVGVVGDFTLDGYWYADMTRSELSRETPLFSRPVVRERYTCGGAANVAWNLSALQPSEVHAFTVIGDDWRGDLLSQALREVGVPIRDAVTSRDWSTPFFGKVILSAYGPQQEDARVDFINDHPLPVESEEELLAHLENSLPELDALVIADYHDAGVITARILERLNQLSRLGIPRLVTVDSRQRIGSFRDMVRKPNQQEAAAWLFPGRAPGLIGLEEFAEAGLHPQIDCGCPLFITLAERGCLVLAGGESHLVPVVPVSPPLDTVGAGDSFLSALTLALAAGATALEAAQLGHLAAAVTVKKLGITGAAAPDEIIKIREMMKPA